jgi:putative ABC transport system ATP-binding protein
MIQVENVFVVFFPGTPLERIALRGVNFDIKEGQIIALLGNSGSGRSTLLKFLAGHTRCSFGRIKLDGIDITGMALSEQSRIFSSVFYEQSTGTAANMTVAENLAMASMHHQPRSFLAPAIDSNMKDMYYQQLKELNFMGMEKLLEEKVHNISVIHRHVLALLIAVIKEARVLLIDEHSTGLDEESAAALLEITEKIIKERHITTVMAVNDPIFSMRIADQILILNHGQVTANLDSSAVKALKPGDLFETFNMTPDIAIESPAFLSGRKGTA